MLLGQKAMVCDSDKHFAISQGQMLEMLPSDFLEFTNVNNNLYALEIKDANGNIIPDNILTYHADTRTYIATVTDTSSNNKCWSNFMLSGLTNSNALAKCKSLVERILGPNGFVNLTPAIIDDGSSGFVSLSLDQTVFDCDDHGKTIKVKLSAIDANNIISQCPCDVKVEDKLPGNIIMKSNVNIQVNALTPTTITPEMVGTFYDNCAPVSLQVVPNQISCDSPNPLTVKLVAQDKSGAVISASTLVNHTSTNMINTMVCNDQITVMANPTASVVISPAMILEGNYSCNASFEVSLSYNGVTFPNPEVSWNDAGKNIFCAVKEIHTGNTCWGTLNVVHASGCSLPFVVCDTRCPDDSPGDCNSGYTNDDNLDWPCGFDIYVCDNTVTSNLSPNQLTSLYGVPLKNTKPQFVNYNCSAVFMAYSDQVISINGIGDPSVKVFRTWTVLDWSGGITYTYVQIFYVYVNSLEICDTAPWNTPFGDCASGHTGTDAVEWPADITVSFANVSITALKANPLVHPNDVEPVLVGNCSSVFGKTYLDVVTNIDANTKLVTRTWSVLNWQTNQSISYVQTITLLTNAANLVCVKTYYDEPINDVNLGLGVTDESGCATINFVPNYEIRPSKSSNAREGIDIMDLVTIYEGILNIRKLNPYQKIAADINGVNGVTTLDMIYIQKLLDGDIDNWPGTTPVWKFIDKNHQIINETITPYHDFINTNNLIYSNEFIGIKMGDVNGSYRQDEDGNRPAFTVLKADDVALNKGETYQTSFSSDRNQSLVAVKLDFNIKDKGISILNVESDILPGFDQTKHVIITENNISISWAIDLEVTPQGISLRNNEDFLKITYISNKNSIISDVLDLNLEVSNQIKQNGDVDPVNVNLFWDFKIINGIADAAVSRLNVTPNPFTNSISVLGLNEDAQYDVLNSAGISIHAGNMPVDGQLVLSNIENGFYFLRIFEKGKKPSIHKLIKIE